jgi:hypothetical protein
MEFQIKTFGMFFLFTSWAGRTEFAGSAGLARLSSTRFSLWNFVFSPI